MRNLSNSKELRSETHLKFITIDVKCLNMLDRDRINGLCLLEVTMLMKKRSIEVLKLHSFHHHQENRKKCLRFGTIES